VVLIDSSIELGMKNLLIDIGSVDLNSSSAAQHLIAVDHGATYLRLSNWIT
jgi:anti-anti-sigma regulatory factor